jgi:hypothetical protein
MTVLDDAAKILATRGYLVIGSTVRLKPGYIAREIHGTKPFATLGQPVQVVRETTFDDFAAQAAVIDEKVVYSWPYFYVVVTD